MKSSRMMWVLTLLVVLTTLGLMLGTSESHSQQKSTAKSQTVPTPRSAYEDLSKYAIAEYDASASLNAEEREKRKIIGQRYDNQSWVIKKPRPGTDGVGRYDEIPPPPIIPEAVSDLIVVGEVLRADAYISNDKGGVYTEFTIRANDVLKNDALKEIHSGSDIVADRAGGFVRYPNGQKILYRNSERDLPGIGGEYVLFLIRDAKSRNYEILTGYELKGESLRTLDFPGSRDEEVGRMGRQGFLNSIRNAVARPSRSN